MITLYSSGVSCDHTVSVCGKITLYNSVVSCDHTVELWSEM